MQSQLTINDIVDRMERVLTQLTEEQLLILRERSAASGRSVAALIREAVDAWIGDRRHAHSVEAALGAVGRFRSGLGDLAEQHDRYLEDES
jgi:hypothetical protein